jgi:hypothetical protein
VHSRTTHERTHASPLGLFLSSSPVRNHAAAAVVACLFLRPTPAMPGAAVCRHSSTLLSSIDSPLAPPLYAFACAPAANPSPRLAWSPPATTGSGALAAPLRWPRCLDVLPRPLPELSLDLAVLGHPPVSPMVWCCCCLLGWWWPLSVDASVALVCWWRWCRRCTSFPTLLPGTMAVLDCNPDGTCYCYVVLFGVMVWLMVRWCGCCYYFDLNQDTGGTASGCNPASSDSWSRDIPVVLLLQWFTNGDDATTAASTTLQG